VRTEDFDYELPDEIIAQTPADPRDSCRLLVLDRLSGALEHRRFGDILDYLDPGDLLVVNETRVLPARLRGTRAGGGAAELLLLKEECDRGPGVLSHCDRGPGVLSHCTRATPSPPTGRSTDPPSLISELWECLARPGKRIREGDVLTFGEGRLTAEVVERRAEGRRLVRLSVAADDTVSTALHALGETPLPPYITQQVDDPELYQTVYANADDEHSAAAPTAGLHFTPELLAQAQARGVGLAKLRLDVGLDTFRPVTEDDPTQHVIHTEYYYVPPEAAAAINATRARGGRVIAVGTTVVRALESASCDRGPGVLSHVGEGGTGAASDPEHSADGQSFAAASSEVRVEDVRGRGSARPTVRSTGGPTSLYILPGFEFQVVDALITNFHVPRSTLMMLVSAFASREQILTAYAEAVQRRYRFFSFGDAMLIR